MDRVDLLNEIYSGRTRLESVLTPLRPEQMTEPDLPGGWSVKDLLAHLGWWEERVVEIYHALVKGESPERPITPDQVDTVNAEIIEQFRARDLDEVREYERAAFREVLSLVETAPEADLFDAQRFPKWTNGRPFLEWILGNTSGHYEEHWSSLESKIKP